MSAESPHVYLNGSYVPTAAAMVSVEDRGFLFGDGCYEVTLAVRGTCVALDRHLARLQRGLDELRIDFDAGSLASIHDELMRRNGLADAPMVSLYAQVTRGVAPRSHRFPEGVTPTVLVRATAVGGPDPRRIEHGSRALTAPDIRWGRVDLKTIGLLPNVLAEQAAADAGLDDVILHRDGLVMEGARTNVYGVIDGVIVTAPADHRILAGVTRSIVFDLAATHGLAIVERDWTLDELRHADEVFMSSTTSGVRPIIEVDGHRIGSGERGAVTHALQSHYLDFIGCAPAGESTASATPGPEERSK